MGRGRFEFPAIQATAEHPPVYEPTNEIDPHDMTQDFELLHQSSCLLFRIKAEKLSLEIYKMKILE